MNETQRLHITYRVLPITDHALIKYALKFKIDIGTVEDLLPLTISP